MDISNLDINTIDLFIKTPVVFLHFLLAAIALVLVFSLDFTLLFNYNKPISESLYNKLKLTERIINPTLFLLYITGIYFVVYGTTVDVNYISNEKLLFKFIVVAVLTVNGFFVNLITKQIEIGTVISDFPIYKKLTLTLIGTVSSVSWVWSCFLGVARSWNFKVDMWVMSCSYLISSVLVFCLLTLIMFVIRTPKVKVLSTRKILNHKNNLINDQIEINAVSTTDRPRYELSSSVFKYNIEFQKGGNLNGITNECLLAILIDRFRTDANSDSKILSSLEEDLTKLTLNKGTV